MIHVESCHIWSTLSSDSPDAVHDADLCGADSTASVGLCACVSFADDGGPGGANDGGQAIDTCQRFHRFDLLWRNDGAFFHWSWCCCFSLMSYHVSSWQLWLRALTLLAQLSGQHDEVEEIHRPCLASSQIIVQYNLSNTVLRMLILLVTACSRQTRWGIMNRVLCHRASTVHAQSNAEVFSLHVEFFFELRVKNHCWVRFDSWAIDFIWNSGSRQKRWLSWQIPAWWHGWKTGVHVERAGMWRSWTSTGRTGAWESLWFHVSTMDVCLVPSTPSTMTNIGCVRTVGESRLNDLVSWTCIH